MAQTHFPGGFCCVKHVHTHTYTHRPPLGTNIGWSNNPTANTDVIVSVPPHVPTAADTFADKLLRRHRLRSPPDSDTRQGETARENRLRHSRCPQEGQGRSSDDGMICVVFSPLHLWREWRSYGLKHTD